MLTDTEPSVTKNCQGTCVESQKKKNYTKYKSTNIKIAYTVGLEHIKTPSGSGYSFKLRPIKTMNMFLQYLYKFILKNGNIDLN